jgi:hypothetical protein
MTTKDQATIGRLVRRKDKNGRPYYLDRESGKRVKSEAWKEERLRIRSAEQKRKEEVREGKKPETKVPRYIPKEVRAEREKRRQEREARRERYRRWEEERKRALAERRRFLENEKRRKLGLPELPPLPPPGAPLAPPPPEGLPPAPGGSPPGEKGPEPPPGVFETPEEYEDIEFFEVDDMVGFDTGSK